MPGCLLQIPSLLLVQCALATCLDFYTKGYSIHRQSETYRTRANKLLTSDESLLLFFKIALQVFNVIAPVPSRVWHLKGQSVTCLIVGRPTFTLFKDCRVFSFKYSQSQFYAVISALFVESLVILRFLPKNLWMSSLYQNLVKLYLLYYTSKTNI